MDYRQELEELYGIELPIPSEEQLAEWNEEASLFEQEMLAEAAAEEQEVLHLKQHPEAFVQEFLEDEEEFSVTQVINASISGSRTMLEAILEIYGKKVHWKMTSAYYPGSYMEPPDWDYDVEEIQDFPVQS